MIISYRHNFVFIKTRKTAGSSLETVLADHAGREDIVTPLGFFEEVERFQTHPEAFPRNFAADRNLEERFRSAVRAENKREMKAVLQQIKEEDSSAVASLRRHGGALQAKNFLGQDAWDASYKFSIERHPYEKAVSLAWFERRKKKTFEEALEDVLQGTRYRNFDHYTIEGKLAVDFMIRYEHMAEDLGEVEKRLGFQIYEKLPRSNTRQRTDRRPASEVLSATQKEIVHQTCHAEFEFFGYQT